MQVHTVAYAAKIPSASPAFALTAVQDQFFSALGSTAFLLPSEMKLIAAFAIGPSLQRARVNSPSLLRVGFPSIRPIQQAATAPNDPNMMVLHHNQLHLPPGEPVGIDAVTGTDQDLGIALVWFRHAHPQHMHPGQMPMSPGHHEGHHGQHHEHGESFWLRYTAQTSPDGSPANSVVSPLRWSQLNPVFDQVIPSGTYEVIGFEHAGTTAIGARLIFPGSVYRPGTIANTSVAQRTFEGFYNGSFGIYGTFQTISPPAVEVLCTATDAAPHEGYMRLIRVGDLTAQQTHGHQHGSAGAGGPSTMLPVSHAPAPAAHTAVPGRPRVIS